MKSTNSTLKQSKGNQSISKVILQPLFGEPYSWTKKYLKNIAQVEGYDWKIFTPHKFKVGKNTELIDMHLVEFDKLVEKATGVEPFNFLDGPAPHKNLTDYYPAYGHIFQEYAKDYDYWGHTNWDCVYGRMTHFLPDKELAKADIWADESNSVNGTFSLYKNKKEINELYQNVQGWQKVFMDHKLYGFEDRKSVV